MTKSIPWAEPSLWGREEEYAVDALRSTWISGGPYVDRFEKDFAAFTSAKHALAVANGTAALHLAYLAAGINPGDEVIVPGFAFMAAANMVRMVGASPVFADVDPETWCVTATTIEAVLTPKTRCIVPVHTYGTVCDMDPIMELASDRGLLVIEDAAEAIGSKYKGQVCGTIAPVGIYSFHAAKTITTGEGGAVVTNDDALAQRMRLFRSHGMGQTRYFHELAGHNFRLTNLQAAIGCAQLEQVEKIIELRSKVLADYQARLFNMKGLSLQKIEADVDPVLWAIAVRLAPEWYPQGRDEVIRQMSAAGIETRPGFYPASSMPQVYGKQDLPVSDALGASILVLPSGPGLEMTQIARICTALEEFQAK